MTLTETDKWGFVLADFMMICVLPMWIVWKTNRIFLAIAVALAGDFLLWWMLSKALGR